MDATFIIGSSALILAPVLFAVMAAVEARRVVRFLRDGARTEGEIIGEELRGIKNRAPYPVVRFRDSSGAVRQVCSRISKRTRGFIHPQKVRVIYLSDRPEEAEIFSGIHAYKHLIGICVALVLAGLLAVLALPTFFER